MERPLPEDEDSADDNTEYDKDSYSNSDFSKNERMPSEEDSEEEMGRHMGGFGRGLTCLGLSRFLKVATAPQWREDTVSAETDNGSTTGKKTINITVK